MNCSSYINLDFLLGVVSCLSIPPLINLRLRAESLSTSHRTSLSTSHRTSLSTSRTSLSSQKLKPHNSITSNTNQNVSLLIPQTAPSLCRGSRRRTSSRLKTFTPLASPPWQSWQSRKSRPSLIHLSNQNHETNQHWLLPITPS